MTFLQIKLRGKASHTGSTAYASVRSVEPAIAAVMASQGIQADRINTIRWPAVGASRWSTATVLMHSDDLETLASIQYDGGVAAGPYLYVDLLYHTLTFPQMIVGRVTPILATDATKSLFLVELHDRRWQWRNWRPRGPRATDGIDSVMGYNMLSHARGRVIERTTNSGTLWTPKGIVERVLAGDPTNGIPALQLSTDVYLGEIGTVSGIPLTDTSRPGYDFDTDDNAGAFIDRVMAKSGAVFVFVPSVTEGKTYDIALHDVGSGEGRAVDFLDDYGDHLCGGGLETVVDTSLVSGWTTGAKRNAYANRDLVRRDCPDKVRVYFPFALAAHDTPGLHDGESCEHDMKFAARASWDSDSGRPSAWTVPDANAPDLYHIVDDWPMVTERSGESTSGDIYDALTLENRAEQVAICYYQRFSAGCCDMWLRGSIPLNSDTVWSGAQVWTFELRDAADEMPFVTHVEGDRNSPLFGWMPNVSSPVRGLGGVTAFRGPDGSLRVVGNVVGHIPILIRLKSATPIDGADNRWEYAAKILQRDGTDWAEWADITAFNSVERNNTATFVGPSTKLPLAVGGTWAALPIGEDRDGGWHDVDYPAFLVEDRTLAEDPIAIFGDGNMIDGEC